LSGQWDPVSFVPAPIAGPPAVVANESKPLPDLVAPLAPPAAAAPLALPEVDETFLCAGAVFTKHHQAPRFPRRSSAARLVFYDKATASLYWASVGKGRKRKLSAALPLSEVGEVQAAGNATDARYSPNCLFIVAEHRTLVLEAATEFQRDRWVKHLNLLLTRRELDRGNADALRRLGELNAETAALLSLPPPPGLVANDAKSPWDVGLDAYATHTRKLRDTLQQQRKEKERRDRAQREARAAGGRRGAGDGPEATVILLREEIKTKDRFIEHLRAQRTLPSPSDSNDDDEEEQERKVEAWRTPRKGEQKDADAPPPDMLAGNLRAILRVWFKVTQQSKHARGVTSGEKQGKWEALASKQTAVLSSLDALEASLNAKEGTDNNHATRPGPKSAPERVPKSTPKSKLRAPKALSVFERLSAAKSPPRRSPPSSSRTPTSTPKTRRPKSASQLGEGAFGRKHVPSPAAKRASERKGKANSIANKRTALRARLPEMHATRKPIADPKVAPSSRLYPGPNPKPSSSSTNNNTSRTREDQGPLNYPHRQTAFTKSPFR
jgi:hypothetical protein